MRKTSKTPESQCLEHAIRLLTRTTQSKRRLHEKLSAAYPTTLIEDTLKELEARGMLNEEKDCRLWLNHHLMGSKSNKEIFYALLKRGYAKELVTKVMKEIGDDREIEVVQKLLQQKLSGKPKTEVAVQKAWLFLQRKGFSTNVIRVTLQQQKFEEELLSIEENTDSSS